MPKFFARQETKLGVPLTASKRVRSEVSEDQGDEDKSTSTEREIC